MKMAEKVIISRVSIAGNQRKIKVALNLVTGKEGVCGQAGMWKKRLRFSVDE
jgi:hypothetical protein